MIKDICLNHNDVEVVKWFNAVGEYETYRQYVDNNGLPELSEAYLTLNQAKQHIDNFIPEGQFEYENIKSILSELPLGAQAAFWNNTFYFKDLISKNEVNEEVFHAVVSTILTDSQRRELYTQGAKLINVDKEVKRLSALYPETYDKLSDSEKRDRVIEEHLASMFVDFMNKGSESKLSDFIRKIFDLIKGLFGFGDRDYINSLFQDIKSGKFRNANIVYSENATPSTYIVKGKNSDGSTEELGEAESEQVLRNLTVTYFNLRQTGFNSGQELLDDVLTAATEYYGDSVVSGAFIKSEEFFNDEGEIETAVNPDYAELISELQDRIKKVDPKAEDLLEADQGDNITDENSDSGFEGMGEFHNADEDGFTNISGWLKMYIASVGNPVQLVTLTDGREIQFYEAIDQNKIYYGVARALNNSKNDFERLVKLINYGELEGNSAAKSLVNKIFTDVEGNSDNILNDYWNRYRETGDASIINDHVNSEKAYILQNILKGFDLWSRTNMFQGVSPESGATFTRDANVNNAVSSQIANWQENLKGLNPNIEMIHSIVSKTAIQGDFYANLKQDITDNVFKLKSVGIEVSPETIKWLLINNLDVNKAPLTAKDLIRYQAFKSEIDTFGTKEEVRGLLDNLSQYITEETLPDLYETGDQRTRLERLAKINGVFDESVFESSYKTADGKTKYGFQWKTFDLEFIANLQDEKFLSSLMNNGIMSYRTDENGQDVYLDEAQDFIHNNLFLKQLFKQENGKYVPDETKIRSMLPYFKLISVDGIRQVIDTKKDDKVLKAKRKEIDAKIQEAIRSRDRKLYNDLVKERTSLKEVEGREGDGKTFTGMTTAEFDVYRLNIAVNKVVKVGNDNLYPHYIGNLEAKRTADFVYLPELRNLVTNKGVSKEGVDLLTEEVRKEYDRIKRVHKELKEAIELNSAVVFNAEGEAKLSSDLLRQLLKKDVYDKYHTGTIIRSGEVGNYTYSGVRALEFSDSVNGIMDKGFMQSTLVQSALEGKPLPDLTNEITEHWHKTILPAHMSKFSSQESLLDERWKVNGKLDKVKLGNFVLSSFINVLSFNQMIQGDPALLYKNDKDGGTDMYKRFGGRNAAIQSAETFLIAPELGITEPKTRHRFVVGQEFKSKVAYDPTTSIDQADAQNYATTEYKRYLLWSRGKLTKFLADVLDDVELGIPLTEAKKKVMLDTSQFLNVDKTVAFNGIQYLKKSDFMLTKELTSRLTNEAQEQLKGLDQYSPEARKIRMDENNWTPYPDTKFHHELRQNMEGWRENKERVLVKDSKKKYDLYMPASASKMLNTNIYNPETGWNNIDGSIMHIDSKNYGLQLENPAGKERIIDPSQMLEIIFNEQSDQIEIFYKNEDKPRTVASLEKLYQQYLTDRDNSNFDISYNDLINEEGEFDATNFFPKAVRSLKASGADPQVIKIFSETHEDGTPMYNANMGITKEKFTNLIFAHITKGVLQQKVAGDALAHVSSYGFKPLKRILKIKVGDTFDYTWDEVGRGSAEYNNVLREFDSDITKINDLDLENTHKGIIYDPTLPTDGLRETLKELYESGERYFTDELRHLKPRYNFDLANSTTDYMVVKGKPVAYYSESLIPASRLDDQEITNNNKYNFAVRIPSQDKHSAINVEWIGVLPMYYGNSYVGPKELVAISGSDFDIDKVFMHKPELYKYKGKYIPYGSGDKWVEYIEFLKNHHPQFAKKYSELKRNLFTRDLEMDSYYNDLREELRDTPKISERYKELETQIEDLYQEYALQNEYINETIAKPIALLKELRLPIDAISFKNPYAINNEILELKQIALTNEGTLLDQGEQKAIYKTAATMDALKDLDKDEDFQVDGVSVFAKVDPMPAHMFDKHSKVHTKNTVGKQNINPYVNGNLGLILGVRAGYKLNPDFQFTINGYRAVGFQKLSADNQRIFDTLSTLISAATDEAKEQLNAKYNINLDGAAIVKTMISLGFSLKTSVAFLNQPVIQNYLNIKAKRNNSIYLENVFQTDEQIVQGLVGDIEMYTGSYGDVELTAALRGTENTREFEARLLHDLDIINKINAQTSQLTRFLKVKKGFVDGLQQLDQLNDSVDSLGFYLDKMSYKSFMENNPLNTHLTLSTNIKDKIPQVVNVIENILPKVNRLSNKLFFERNGLMQALRNDIKAQLANLNEEKTIQLNKEIESYVFMRLYLEEENISLNNELFVKGENYDTVGEKLNNLRKEVNRLLETGAKTKDEELILSLAGTSIVKRLTVKDRNGIDEIKLDTFSKLSPEQQDTLITSFGKLIKTLAYLSDGNEFKSLHKDVFHYWMVKDGFQNKFGSVAKVFPVHMFQTHSNTIGKAMAGNSPEFNSIKNNQNFKKDILQRIAQDKLMSDKMLKSFYSGEEGKLHTRGKYAVDLSKVVSSGDLIGYPFGYVESKKHGLVITSVPFYLKTSVKTLEGAEPTPISLELTAVQFQNDEVIRNSNPEFYNIVYDRTEEIKQVNYKPITRVDNLGQSAMTVDMNYSQLYSEESLLDRELLSEDGLTIDSNTSESQENLVSLDSQTIENQEDMNPNTFINYSGAAEGGDKYWEKIGKEFGIGKQVNYITETLSKLSSENKVEVENAYQQAVRDLGRKPLSADSYAGKLVRRDYLQAKSADSIFAISSIIQPNQTDKKGYKNRTKKEIVSGGTGYAVQMGINLGKPVYVFDQDQGKWFLWNGNRFVEIITPTLTSKYAGIGTRELTQSGQQAIRDVYEKTFKSNTEDGTDQIPTNC